ncbi:AP2/ERF and B3 domain-containing transcription factor At1g50680-like [Corylus avellana]|uniref:AP2/ERF and B3 domain-containing transcription factor At1g50680-like n=1 Tax=Corylus avellana TaxID=13451 RepID=UPI00286C8C2E|nr:AP2/ERF and B3 domain-containing transcription factor At1g50680-like [Corylus avellana]
MAKRAGGGDHVCGGSDGDREKRLKCVHSRPPHVFQKILTRSDIEESQRVYIPKSDAAKSFLGAFGCPSNERRVVEVDLIFYDKEKKPWTIRLRSDGDRYYLSRGWNQFARVNKLSERDTVTFYELKSRRGMEEKAIMVGVTCNGRVQLFGVDLTRTQS